MYKNGSVVSMAVRKSSEITWILHLFAFLIEAPIVWTSSGFDSMAVKFLSILSTTLPPIFQIVSSISWFGVDRFPTMTNVMLNSFGFLYTLKLNDEMISKSNYSCWHFNDINTYPKTKSFPFSSVHWKRCNALVWTLSVGFKNGYFFSIAVATRLLTRGGTSIV